MTHALTAPRAHGVRMPKRGISQPRIDKELFTQARIRALQEGFSSAEAWIEAVVKEALKKPARKAK